MSNGAIELVRRRRGEVRDADEADAGLADDLGGPLSKLCFEGPADDLNRTNVSQPAIYACSVACWRALEEGSGPIAIDATAGLSLGEYTALWYAGSLAFEDALRLVRLRGEAMQAASEEIAILMKDIRDRPDRYLKDIKVSVF